MPAPHRRSDTPLLTGLATQIVRPLRAAGDWIAGLFDAVASAHSPSARTPVPIRVRRDTHEFPPRSPRG